MSLIDLFVIDKGSDLLYPSMKKYIISLLYFGFIENNLICSIMSNILGIQDRDEKSNNNFFESLSALNVESHEHLC